MKNTIIETGTALETVIDYLAVEDQGKFLKRFERLGDRICEYAVDDVIADLTQVAEREGDYEAVSNWDDFKADFWWTMSEFVGAIIKSDEIEPTDIIDVFFGTDSKV